MQLTLPCNCQGASQAHVVSCMLRFVLLRPACCVCECDLPGDLPQLVIYNGGRVSTGYARNSACQVRVVSSPRCGALTVLCLSGNAGDPAGLVPPNGLLAGYTRPQRALLWAPPAPCRPQGMCPEGCLTAWLLNQQHGCRSAPACSGAHIPHELCFARVAVQPWCCLLLLPLGALSTAVLKHCTQVCAFNIDPDCLMP